MSQTHAVECFDESFGYRPNGGVSFSPILGRQGVKGNVRVEKAVRFMRKFSVLYR